MNLSVGGIFGHQQYPERVAQAVNHIESKAVDVKNNIEQLLFMLDLQEKVPWPDMLDKFSSLASAMTQLQFALKKSALPSGNEDYGMLLRTHLLVPHRLSIEVDSNLQQLTNNRIHCWNHDVAPDYLRTKLTPEMEADEAQIDTEKNNRTFDQINKQILAMNKHVESLLSALSESARGLSELHTDTPTYNNQDTQRLVRAVVNGEGLRPTRGSGTTDNPQPQGPGSAGLTGTQSHSSRGGIVSNVQSQQRR
ncbi:hypothetical protein AB6A40_000266 [Gnathostoma spinigerum]|uniref:Mediator of RNA polymerase II transcription subunit 8 n=1 Tax=Gnathostoma spinigerum TaxID=75299 RepID=A0ABD6E3V0_9BILA